LILVSPTQVAFGFSGADLSGANLSGASLIEADRSMANLRGADLAGVKWNDKTVGTSPIRIDGAKNIPAP
jgi:uncharacterized protein YjbI with pentapeptide repeats